MHTRSGKAVPTVNRVPSGDAVPAVNTVAAKDGGPAGRTRMAGSSRPNGGTTPTGGGPPAGRTVAAGDMVDVWWFDTRTVTVGPDGLADLDRGERNRAEAFLFPADRRRY